MQFFRSGILKVGTTLFFMGLLLASPVKAQTGEVHFDISYRFAYDRVSPDPKQNITIRRSAYVALHGDGQVRYYEGRTRRLGGRVRSFGKQGQSNLGEFTDEVGGWQVVGPRTLRGIYKWGNSAIVLTVHAVSDRQCTANSKVLKPVTADVVRMQMASRPGTIGSYSNFRAISVNCVVVRD